MAARKRCSIPFRTLITEPSICGRSTIVIASRGDDLRLICKVIMISAHIELILIVTGAITAIALLQLIAPVLVLRTIFGAAPTDEVGLAVARHWGLLTFLVGALLVYAAFHPSVRGPAIVIAVIEKAALGLGVFATSLRTHSAAAAVAAGDSLIAIIYVLYLAG